MKTTLQKFHIHSSVSMVLLMFLALLGACKKNQAPVIVGITLDQNETSAGKIYTFVVEAYDEDDDVLQYTWTASGGQFVSPTDEKEVDWESPISGGGQSYAIQVTVSDGELSVSSQYDILLTEAIFGSISGNVYYSKCLIPIPNVTIKIADKEAITNSEGYFTIEKVLAGKDSIGAFKEDFSPIKLAVNIPPNAGLMTNIEMISIVHSTKLFGKIVDQNGDALAGAQAVILNPDGSESKLVASTDGSGIYRIPYVPHGNRIIVVRKAIINDNKFQEIRG